MRFLLFCTHQLPPMSQLDSDTAFQVTLDSTLCFLPHLTTSKSPHVFTKQAQVIPVWNTWALDTWH